MSAYRLPGLAGAWIDRSQKLNFNFDGRALQGYFGDTLASELLATGSMHVAQLQVAQTPWYFFLRH